jgi:hypothetical protein
MQPTKPVQRSKLNLQRGEPEAVAETHSHKLRYAAN